MSDEQPMMSLTTKASENRREVDDEVEEKGECRWMIIRG